MILKYLLMFSLYLPLLAWGQGLTDADKERLLEKEIRSVQHLAFSPILVNAVQEQNAQGLSMDTIRQREQEWTATQELTPFKLDLQNSHASKMLSRYIESNPDFLEAILLDNQGANVAVHPVPGDYWHGDEEKWAAAFNNGAGQIVVGLEQLAETATDDDAAPWDQHCTNCVPISVPVIANGRAIGVLIVGVSIDYLKQQATQ